MREELLKSVQEKGNIPPLPDVLIRLENKIEDPDGDINDIAVLIDTEPVLSGRLITLANSVFFGGGREKVENLKGAILRLGLKMILDLAYTLEVPKLFSRVKGFDQKRFWKHSLATAVLARTLSFRFEGNRSRAEVCYLAGLMHDIGVMVFHYLVPDEYSEFLLRNKDATRSLGELERERFGISHDELGARFVEKWWPVDEEVVAALKYHHGGHDTPETSASVVQVVTLANTIANHNDMSHGLSQVYDELDRKLLIDKGMSLDDYKAMVHETTETLAMADEILVG